MAQWKCTKCGEVREGRCKPRKCQACGNTKFEKVEEKKKKK